MRRYSFILALLLLAAALCAQNPPENLTATAGNGYVVLNWQPPMINGMYEVFYHDGVQFNAYVQLFEQGYGAIFDLSGYPACTLTELDFRHSSYGVSGPHNYNIHLIDWGNMEELDVIENLTTTVNDNWEEGIDLGDLAGVDLLGVFIEPLSNTSQDAYPVVDCDAALGFTSYVIDINTYEILTSNGAIGDFLIDLWITPTAGQMTQAPRMHALSPQRSRATGQNTQQVRPHQQSPLPPSRDLIGYKVYRNSTLLIDEPLPYHQLTYTDADVTNDQTYSYWVTAMYDTGESIASNTVQATPSMPEDIVFYESFEGGVIPPGWRNYDEDGDTFKWVVAPVGIDGHESSRALWSQSYDNGVLQPLNPDNWIVMPAIDIEEDCYLKFWVRTQDYDFPTEHYEVWVSTDSSDVEDFSTMLYEETTTAEDWHRVSISLSSYVGETCYFAWRHCNSTNNYAVKIDEIFITTNLVAGGESSPEPHTELRAWPNPFNPETTVAFELEHPETVNLAVYDVRGRKVTTLAQGLMSAGAHSVVWNGTDASGNTVASGVYFCRLEAGNASSTRKLLLLK